MKIMVEKIVNGLLPQDEKENDFEEYGLKEWQVDSWTQNSPR